MNENSLECEDTTKPFLANAVSGFVRIFRGAGFHANQY